MALNNLDLDALEIFRTVAVEGGITKAADKLHRVQSNISTRIMQLEQRLNTTLFHRINRKLELTTEGRQLLIYTDRLLQLAEETEASFRTDQISGIFRLGTMESTAAARLPELLSQYHRQHSEVRIELVTDTTAGLIEQVQNYGLDAAFVGEPINSEQLDSLIAFDETLVLITPKGKGFQQAKDAIQENLITFRSGCAYRMYFENWLADEGMSARNSMEMSSYHAITACVAAGTGIAVVPESVLSVLPASTNIDRFALPPQFANVRTLLIWRKDYQSGKLEGLKRLV